MRVAACRVFASVVGMAAVVCGSSPSNHNGVHPPYSFPTFSSSSSSSPSSSIFASYNITSLSKISTSLNSKRLSNDASPRNGDENNIKVVYKSKYS
ncbi:hypothetical protein E2C01_051202 [Portunus trituberculatus]|uniref:Uncharacterized protein n=1 Tax=Portunus trituberculatus TaxID=210409 RepID=A0A5B7GI04_PORTR|nr:hypothetical protein [Portunus trituberculatus]